MQNEYVFASPRGELNFNDNFDANSETDDVTSSAQTQQIHQIPSQSSCDQSIANSQSVDSLSTMAKVKVAQDRNKWSGYHVIFRNPRNLNECVIDKSFDRWGDMVQFFKNQQQPYRLSHGSLKDLYYGTYKRKAIHCLSLNDLVQIDKIEREKKSKRASAASKKISTANMLVVAI